MMSPASSICINWQSEPTILDGRTLASRIHDDRERHTNSAKTYHKDRDNRVWRRVECFLTTCSHFLARNHHCNGVSSHRRRKGQRWPVVIYDPHTHTPHCKKNAEMTSSHSWSNPAKCKKRADMTSSHLWSNPAKCKGCHSNCLVLVLAANYFEAPGLPFEVLRDENLCNFWLNCLVFLFLLFLCAVPAKQNRGQRCTML
jgi:hypothetical protein